MPTWRQCLTHVIGQKRPISEKVSIGNGNVTATKSGTATVTVATAGGTKYNAKSNAGTYTVTFAKQDPSITASTSLSGTLGGTGNVALASGTGYNSGTMGVVSYAINSTGNTSGATINSTAGSVDLSNATISPAAASATIGIRATIAANAKYNLKTVDYDVTINRASNTYSYLGSSLNSTALTIADTAQYTLPNAGNLKLSTSSSGSSEVAYDATKMGALTFEVTDKGGITGISTGNISAGTSLVANPNGTGTGNSGTITIKVKLAGGTKYNAKEFTYNVIYN